MVYEMLIQKIKNKAHSCFKVLDRTFSVEGILEAHYPFLLKAEILNPMPKPITHFP
jgi:hypothetical protein